MKIPLSWLREFADVPAAPPRVAAALAACGFAVESIEGDVIDFEVTANRPDCLSVVGLAREAATAFDVALKMTPARASAGKSLSQALPVFIESPACGRYALALADVTVGSSPAWLADRLIAAGVRPINNVVDVTNYVMIEMGHPLHAFDVAKLAGAEVHVRAARAGERLTTLDGQTRALDPAMLVIADRERAVAVAGVMGGVQSEVSSGTTRIALESAWFVPGSVRATSKRLGLKTEASTRFERGADIDAPTRAIATALALLEQIGAGRGTGALTDVYPQPAPARRLRLDRAHVARLLGEAVPDPDVERILAGLGFVTTPSPEGWHVDVPSFRIDVLREADLIEEVGRHWGFDRIPPRFPALRSVPRATDAHVRVGREVRRALGASGLQEAVTFTFMEQVSAAAWVAREADIVAIANPLSEKFAVLRPSLLPGLVDALIYNQRRQRADVRLFETGTVFSPAGERPEIGWVLCGAREHHWSARRVPVDFFDAKGVAEAVAEAFGLSLRIEPADDLVWSVPGRAARLVMSDGDRSATVGAIGQVKPSIVTTRGGTEADAVVGGVLSVAPLVAMRGRALRPIAPLPRFPSVVRDLSMLIDERLPADTVRGTIRANAPATLVDVRAFDRYQGKGVPDGVISLSVRLTFRDADRTLTDGDVQQAVDTIVAAMGREHGARLRT